MLATSFTRSEGGKRIDEVVWTAEELDIVEKPNGPAMAALLATGFGTLVLGILTTWAEAKTGFADMMKFQNRVGPLSGKTTIAGIAFVVAFGVLTPLLWKKNLPWVPLLMIAGAMLGLGFLGTFPTFFQLFAPD